MDKKGIKLDVPYSERISRLFVFRSLWMLIVIWPTILLGVWVTALWFLEFFYMLILGKRQKTMWEHQRRFFVWVTDWSSYLYPLSNKRPKLWW